VFTFELIYVNIILEGDQISMEDETTIKPKRRRRTKAEMQAAREAEAKESKELNDRAWKIVDYICCHTNETVVVFKHGYIKTYDNLDAAVEELNKGELPEDAVDTKNCIIVSGNDKMPELGRRRRRRDDEPVRVDGCTESETQRAEDDSDRAVEEAETLN
jgi:hypothetical protein